MWFSVHTILYCGTPTLNYGIFLRLALSVFLPSVEVSIISTSLITITNEFNSYEKVSWVVTSYLIAYTGAYDLPPSSSLIISETVY